MKVLLLVLLGMGTFSAIAADFQQIRKCEGINQYNRSVTAKLYADINKTNKALLILSGLTDNTKFEAIAEGVINDRGEFIGARVRMSDGGFLHHADYYALRGNLYCVTLREKVLINK